MAIYKGNKKVIAIYKGSNPISKVYRGDKLVFGSDNGGDYDYNPTYDKWVLLGESADGKHFVQRELTSNEINLDDIPGIKTMENGKPLYTFTVEDLGVPDINLNSITWIKQIRDTQQMNISNLGNRFASVKNADAIYIKGSGGNVDLNSTFAYSDYKKVSISGYDNISTMYAMCSNCFNLEEVIIDIPHISDQSTSYAFRFLTNLKKIRCYKEIQEYLIKRYDNEFSSIEYWKDPDYEGWDIIDK